MLAVDDSMSWSGTWSAQLRISCKVHHGWFDSALPSSGQLYHHLIPPTNQKTCPDILHLKECRDRSILRCHPTWRVFHAHSLVLSYADHFDGRSVPSHILRKLRFRSPSEVHSIQSCPAVIAPSTALLERRFCTYLLFLIGLMVLYNKLPLLSILI